MRLKQYYKRVMMGLSIIIMASALGGCNSDKQETFEEGLQKEIDRRIASGELAYPDDTSDLIGQDEQGLIEESEEALVGYDMEGNPVKVDGKDVIAYDDHVVYRIGGLYKPGEYVAVATEESAYFGVTMDVEGEVIVSNGTTDNSLVFDTLDGAYLEFSGCKIYPIDKAPEVQKTSDGAYPEGTYKVGTQIPAGEYVIKGDAPSGTILADLNYDTDSTIGYWSNTNSAIVTVKEGEYLEATYGDIYPIAQTEDLKSDNGVYKDGMYKAGFHMAAGTYKLKADVDTAYVEIYSSNTSGSKREELITAEPETTFTVKEGQYVSIIGGEVTLQ